MYGKLSKNLCNVLKAIDNGTANPEKVQRAIVISLIAICDDLDHDVYEPNTPNDTLDSLTRMFGMK